MNTNKPIFLQGTEAAVLADIEKIFEGYDKDPATCKTTEDMQQFSAYWIGKIANAWDEEGNVIGYTEDYHANLFVPIEFDCSIFTTMREVPPSNPVHNYR